MRRKKERSKHDQTNNKVKQHNTPREITFPKTNELPRVGLEPTTLLYTHVRGLYMCSFITYLPPLSLSLSLALSLSPPVQYTITKHGHTLHLDTYCRPTTCDLCGKLLWGIIYHGYHCSGTCAGSAVVAIVILSSWVMHDQLGECMYVYTCTEYCSLGSRPSLSALVPRVRITKLHCYRKHSILCIG